MTFSWMLTLPRHGQHVPIAPHVGGMGSWQSFYTFYICSVLPECLTFFFFTEEIGWGNLEVKSCNTRQFFKLCQFLLLNQLDIVPLNKRSRILSQMVERYHELSVHLPYGINLPHSKQQQLGTLLGSLATDPTTGRQTVAWQSV